MTTEPVHLIADGEAVTSCCGRTPFELPRTDRLTVDPSLAGGCETEVARATRLGFELGKAEGRKQVGEEISEAISMYNQEWSANTWRSIAAGIAREIASEPLRAPSNGLTATPETVEPA